MAVTKRSITIEISAELYQSLEKNLHPCGPPLEGRASEFLAKVLQGSYKDVPISRMIPIWKELFALRKDLKEVLKVMLVGLTNYSEKTITNVLDNAFKEAEGLELQKKLRGMEWKPKS